MCICVECVVVVVRVVEYMWPTFSIYVAQEKRATLKRWVEPGDKAMCGYASACEKLYTHAYTADYNMHCHNKLEISLVMVIKNLCTYMYILDIPCFTSPISAIPPSA